MTVVTTRYPTREDLEMAQFLQAFLPTLAFMLVPIAIPVAAVLVGAIRDLTQAA